MLIIISLFHSWKLGHRATRFEVSLTKNRQSGFFFFFFSFEQNHYNPVMGGERWGWWVRPRAIKVCSCSLRNELEWGGKHFSCRYGPPPAASLWHLLILVVSWKNDRASALCHFCFPSQLFSFPFSRGADPQGLSGFIPTHTDSNINHVVTVLFANEIFKILDCWVDYFKPLKVSEIFTWKKWFDQLSLQNIHVLPIIVSNLASASIRNKPSIKQLQFSSEASNGDQLQHCALNSALIDHLKNHPRFWACLVQREGRSYQLGKVTHIW